MLGILYDLALAPLERARFQKVRAGLVAQACGRVLEIGSGTGLNFPHYHSSGAVLATEPDLAMARRSIGRARRAKAAIQILLADAQKLPFPDDCFDTVVGTLVFCTIPDPAWALREVRRVAKPGARVLLFEHVRLHQPTLARIQDWLTPGWSRVCGGCHLNRDTLSLLRRQALDIVSVKSFWGGLFLVIEAANGNKTKAVSV